MRDFRDAKAMAHTLRAAVAVKGLKITVSQSLELIAEVFGVADWNTFSAAIRAAPEASSEAALPPLPVVESSRPAARVGFAAELEATLHRAVTFAKQRKLEHAGLEHLLLALTDDADASAVLKACDVDLGELKKGLSVHLDMEMASRTVTEDDCGRPNAGFQRVVQRAVIHVQAQGLGQVTGAQLLVAMFSEQESAAAQLLERQAFTRIDAVNYLVHGIEKRRATGSA